MIIEVKSSDGITLLVPVQAKSGTQAVLAQRELQRLASKRTANELRNLGYKLTLLGARISAEAGTYISAVHA